MKKDNRGGAREGAGRKKLNKSMLYTSIDNDYLAKIKELADSESMTVGSWLMKHLPL